MVVYFRLLSESFSFAMNALRTNKLRTLLSLLGVTIGIFSIIAVLAAAAQGLQVLCNGRKHPVSSYCRELIHSMTQLSLLAGLQNDPAGSESSF